MKLTLLPKQFGYTGTEVAEILQKHRIFVEFADADHLVLMLTPQNAATDFDRIAEAFAKVERRAAITAHPPQTARPDYVISPREAVLSVTERLPVPQCIGRICAEFAVSCPPAVPIVMCGERITAEAAACMQYYGIKQCTVIK